MISSVALAGVCFAVSAGLTVAVRAFALRNSILDLPNERSSHTTPTPRGGGAAIAVAALGGIGVAGFLGWVPAALAAGVVAGGCLVAGVGWIDDRGHVAVPLRALVHATAAALVLWSIGGLPQIRFGEVAVDLGWVGTLLGVIGIVWLTNLYNFMDGIDGIAAGEATFVAIIGALLLSATGALGLAAVSWIIAGAAGGFLLWNWPPARIFMGDVGSGLLGFLFGALAVASEAAGAVSSLVWAILLGVFIVDATATLTRRIARRERWYDAHRQHAYQRAVRAGYSHGQVAGAVVVFNLLLGGAAMVSLGHPAWQPILVIAAYLALLLLYAAVERASPMRSEQPAVGCTGRPQQQGNSETVERIPSG
jgi:Fuc2NAc and GlcNAc transferase